MITARATSYSGLKDLVGYIDCLLAGGTETHCYAKGDNGRGCWGDIVATLRKPCVAIPPEEMKAKVGSDLKKCRGMKVEVTLSGGAPFEAFVYDKAPSGVVDLNPGALVAAHLPSDTELNTSATWRWID